MGTYVLCYLKNVTFLIYVCFSNPDRIREFIRAVYVDKKYAGGSSNKPATDSEVMS
jgi:hypothetical protein